MVRRSAWAIAEDEGVERTKDSFPYGVVGNYCSPVALQYSMNGFFSIGWNLILIYHSDPLSFNITLFVNLNYVQAFELVIFG